MGNDIALKACILGKPVQYYLNITRIYSISYPEFYQTKHPFAHMPTCPNRGSNRVISQPPFSSQSFIVLMASQHTINILIDGSLRVLPVTESADSSSGVMSLAGEEDPEKTLSGDSSVYTSSYFRTLAHVTNVLNKLAISYRYCFVLSLF